MQVGKTQVKDSDPRTKLWQEGKARLVSLCWHLLMGPHVISCERAQVTDNNTPLKNQYDSNLRQQDLYFPNISLSLNLLP